MKKESHKKIYFAPLEGITGYIYRNAYQMYFPNIDKYFTPFLSPNQNRAMSPKEIKDIRPENNKGIYLVPQILTNRAEYFVKTARELKDDYGYEEVNLNLGCPSGTVVTKGKGAGFLAKKEELGIFLEEIFEKLDLKISIKTRIGKDSPDEFYELIKIFNKYPLHELIIHPRIQTDFYKNKPNMNVFTDAVALSENPLCYNGDVFTPQDYQNIFREFPRLEAVMLGRGILMNPNLPGEIILDRSDDKKKLKEFHDKLYADYRQVLSGDINVLYKMKELWFHMIHMFSDSEKHMKKIRKATRLCDYEEVVGSLFCEQDNFIQKRTRI